MKRFASLAALVLLVAGCKRDVTGPTAGTTNPAAVTAAISADPIMAVPDKDRYKVTADTTGFYRFSPMQAAGSDADLKKNTRLTMVKHGRGFCQVKLESGQIGYVGTEDISQLAPSEIAQEDAATLQAAQAAAGAQAAAAGIAPANSVPVATRTGRKPATMENSYHIPSDADVNTRLPEPDARPKATPTPSPAVNFR